MCLLPKGVNVLVVLCYPKGLTFWFGLLQLLFPWQFWIITVTMGVYILFPLTTRIGRATSQVGGCLGISSPKCIPPKGLDLCLNDPNRTGNVTTWNYLIMNVLEPMHARINTLLVFNLVDICIKSLTCIGLFFGTYYVLSHADQQVDCRWGLE